MIGRKLKVAKVEGRHEWGLRIEDELGVTYAHITLTHDLVTNLVEQINGAYQSGAQVPQLEIKRG